MRFSEDTWVSRTEGDKVAGQREDGGRGRNRRATRASYGVWGPRRRPGNQGESKPSLSSPLFKEHMVLAFEI